jgi:hypothetical protein
MVYLDAFVPESGQSLWDLAGPEGAGRQQELARGHDGGLSVPFPPEFRAGRPENPDMPPMTPQPVGTLAEKFVSVRDKPAWPRRHYILCSGNPGPTFRQFADRTRSAADWEYGEFAAGHDVILTHPELVAERLAGIASKWGMTDKA